MRVIRLLNEGMELMRSGTITLARPEKDLLITIRAGNYGSLDRVLNLANALFAELEKAEHESQSPEQLDRSKISALVSEAYLRFWNRHRVGQSVEDDDTLSSCGSPRTRTDMGFENARVSSSIVPSADLLSRGERGVRHSDRKGLEHQRIELRKVCHQICGH